ncbi:unnamed protein product [Psylliodes chrysocephalus]|uniref:Uncharacterized protein n=1 Tax=Psylliodes chrysocephalus TaxID=3402493 RepID=A0A9P0D0C5_9CUCU|nr:unnamed protein product [Psylliodes chrysocephala]
MFIYIEKIIQRALDDAKNTLKTLGIESDNDEAFTDIILVKFTDLQNEDCDTDKEKYPENVMYDTHEQGIINKNYLNDFGDFLNMKCKDYKTNTRSLVKCEVNNKIIKIKKSSLCWLLDGYKNKLSSDRLIRVRFQNSTKTTKQITVSLEKYYAIFYFEKWFIGRIIEVRPNHFFKVKFLQDSLDYLDWPKKEDVAVVDIKYIFFGPIDMIGSCPFQITQEVRHSICKEYKNLKRVGL